MPDLKTEIETKVKKRSKFGRQMVSSEPVKRLVDIVGSFDKAAQLLGVSDSGVRFATNRTECTATMAIAAQLHIEKLQRDGTSTIRENRILVMKVPSHKVDAVSTVLKAMDIKVLDVG